VTPSAFDPAGLNRPLARTDVGTAVIGEVPLLNLDAWAGRRAAVNAAASASAREDWTGTGVQLDVLTAYLGAMLSAERVQVLRSGEAAGEAHLRQARSALTNGIVTPSDVLLAEVRLGEITTQRRGAEYDSWLARRQLALLLGTPDDSAMVMPTAVPVLGSAASPSQFLRPGVRGDLQAAALDEAAATADARRAAFALVPRVNAFGRYEWHDPTAPVGGRPMWTIGVMASWTPFSGGAELAARREAQANAAAARTGLEAIGAAARLEGEAAARAVGVAMQAVESTRRGAVQAAEAHRIVARKYEGGLASVAELLDAQATALGADLSAARARHDHLVALATLLRARGTDLSSLATAIDAAAATPE
jgi:outer membrane protein TolC